MPKPRLLLVPQACSIEWTSRTTMEEWAEVASFDAPVHDAEADRSSAGLARVGLAEVDRLGWDRYFVVADEFAAATAARLSAARPEAVAGLALGHACLSLDMDGERAPVNRAMYEAMTQLARGDYAAYAQALAQTTQGAWNEQLARQFNERIPQDVAIEMLEGVLHEHQPIGELIAELGDTPLLFAEHKDCMMFSHEGFEDAVAAFPHAKAITIEGKPSASPEFAEALRTFCAG